MGGIVINRRPHGFKFKVEFVSGGSKVEVLLNSDIY